jgi:hypothetical protein
MAALSAPVPSRQYKKQTKHDPMAAGQDIAATLPALRDNKHFPAQISTYLGKQD